MYVHEHFWGEHFKVLLQIAQIFDTVLFKSHFNLQCHQHCLRMSISMTLISMCDLSFFKAVFLQLCYYAVCVCMCVCMREREKVSVNYLFMTFYTYLLIFLKFYTGILCSMSCRYISSLFVYLVWLWPFKKCIHVFNFLEFLSVDISFLPAPFPSNTYYFYCSYSVQHVQFMFSSLHIIPAFISVLFLQLNLFQCPLVVLLPQFPQLSVGRS